MKTMRWMGIGVFVWLSAQASGAEFRRADRSVLKREVAQAPEMNAAMKAYHAAGSHAFKKPLRVVYFCPNDMEPFAEYQERIERMMGDFEEFLEKEMARNGFKGRSLNLERVDGRLKIHLIEAQKEAAHYTYNSGGEIRQEVSAEFQRRQMRFDQEHVLIFSALAEVTEPYAVRLYAPFYGLGANQMNGLCFVADCPWLDVRNLSDKKTIVSVGEHGRRQRMSLGRFNTVYIGGTIHELGHGMTLPHNRERDFERAVLGTALMGSGNYSYKEELRDEGRGTFLTFASATRLASLGLFNDRVKGLDTKPTCELDDMRFAFRKGSLVVGGRVVSDVPAYAVVAYNDPDGGSDYDAVPWTCAVKPDGSFALAVQDLLPGSLDLRLTICHANGAVSVFSNPYTCLAKEGPDVERLELPWIMRDAVVAYAEGNPSVAKLKARQLLKQHGKRELTSRYLNHLIALCSDPEPLDAPGALDRRVKSAMLSDCRWESANVGWRRPSRNEYSREGKDDTRVFLEIGDAFHPKGLYAHSPSRYVFDLDGKWKRFKTSYGLQRGATGKVVFVVIADGQELFRSDTLEGSKEHEIELDVSDVKRLELVVENGGAGNGNCWSIWGTPNVSR